MAYGSLLADTVQGSTANTPPVFKDGNGTEIGTLCRAWVNFNGTGTVAIRGSFNVSSITDNGTGTYVLNLTTAMPDANGAAVATAIPGTASSSNNNRACFAAVLTTTTVRLNITTVSSNVFDDSEFISCSVFR